MYHIAEVHQLQKTSKPDIQTDVMRDGEMLVRDQFTKKEYELLAFKVMVWISCKLIGKVSSKVFQY